MWTPDSPAYGPYVDAEMLLCDRHAGHIIIDGIERAMTAQCCHCGGHFVVRKGSKRLRGFCSNCSQVTCGAPGCNPCIPFEKKLDLYEKKRLAVLR